MIAQGPSQYAISSRKFSRVALKFSLPLNVAKCHEMPNRLRPSFARARASTCAALHGRAGRRTDGRDGLRSTPERRGRSSEEGRRATVSGRDISLSSKDSDGSEATRGPTQQQARRQGSESREKVLIRFGGNELSRGRREPSMPARDLNQHTRVQMRRAAARF